MRNYRNPRKFDLWINSPWQHARGVNPRKCDQGDAEDDDTTVPNGKPCDVHEDFASLAVSPRPYTEEVSTLWPSRRPERISTASAVSSPTVTIVRCAVSPDSTYTAVPRSSRTSAEGGTTRALTRCPIRTRPCANIPILSRCPGLAIRMRTSAAFVATSTAGATATTDPGNARPTYASVDTSTDCLITIRASCSEGTLAAS